MTRLEQAAKMYARTAAPAAIHEALHTLRHALRARPWTPGEARRVIDIIKQAARDIVDGGAHDE